MSDSVGSVSVDVVPDARGWAEKLRAQIRDYTVKPKVEPDFDPASEERFKEKGKTSGDKFSGEFDRIVKTKLRAALASLPDVEIGADTTDAQKRLLELRTQVETLSKQKVGLDLSSDEALAKIEAVRVELQTLASESPTVEVRVDALAAQAKLAEVKAQVGALDGSTATVDVKTDRSSAGRTTNFVTTLADKLHVLPALAVAGTAALIPLAGALGGVAAALVAPLAIAGAGATLYGFLVGAAIKKTETQKKQIDQLKKAVDSAKQSLANAEASAATSAQNSLASARRSAQNSLAAARSSADASIKAARQAEASATTQAGRDAARRRVAAAQAALAARQASVNSSLASRQAGIQASQTAAVESAQRRVNEATQAYKRALHDLSPEQSKFLGAQDKLKGAFQTLIEKAGPALLGPATQFLQLLTKLLPDAIPILSTVSGVLGDVFDTLDRGSKSQGFQRFVTQFAHQLGPNLRAFAHIIGNLTGGLGGLFLAIDRRTGSGGMLTQLDHLSHTFNEWANSRQARRDVRSFFDYFHQVGPQVGDTIGAVARAGGHLVKALAPLGPPVLRVVEGIADKISGIPVPVLTALAAAFVAITAAAKVGSGISKITSGLGGLSLGGAEGGGLLGKVLGSRGMSPANPLYVFAVNGGGSGGGPNVIGGAGAGAKAGATASEAERAAAAAAKAAAEAAPGGAAAKSSAAARAFKGAMAAHDAAIAREILSFGRTAGARGLLRGVLTGPIIAGQESYANGYDPNHVGGERDFIRAASLAKLTATSTRVDALRANLATASRQIDLVGPRATAAFGAAGKDVDTFARKLAQIHDKKLRIIADTQDAVNKLEALQAFRLKDKAFGVQVELQIERAVGPGGGMGRPTPSGHGGGGSGGGASRSGPTYTGDIHVRAHDYKDFTQQMQARHNRATLDGLRRQG